MDDIRPQTRWYIALITALAVLAVAFAFQLDRERSPRAVLLSLLLTAVLAAVERKPLPFGPHAHLLLDTSVVLAAVLLLPPGFALFVATAGPTIALSRRGDTPQCAFNVAQTVLQAVVAACVLSVSGWERSSFHAASLLIGVPIAGLAMHVANALAVGGVIALESRRAIWRSWVQVLYLDRTEAFGHVSQWGLAMLAVIVAENQAWALLLLVLPGTLVLSSLDRHARLRIRAEEQLVHQAFHDPLTGLPNRAKFTESLNEALDGPGADEIALLFLDLDRFKLINDTMGHDAGDQLLIEVAKRLTASVRPGDLVARLGGDEFVVLIAGAGDDLIELVSGRIAASIAAPVQIDGRDVTVTASIGAARPAGGDHAGAHLLRDADIALYRAKENGRNAIAIYDAGMGADTRERMDIETELRRALTHGGLWVTYQPQIDVASSQTIAMEALVRWDHPGRGLLRPGAFLPIAEETGLILPLGKFVLTDALHSAAAWSAIRPHSPAVAVNIGARQLLDGALLTTLKSAMAVSGVAPEHVRLEISETAVMSDPPATLQVLAKLAETGVHLVLDDFGAERSSLAFLSQLPVKTIALDRALVNGVGQSTGAESVVRAVTAMARELGLIVAAKGVERAEQVECFRSAGCTVLQGEFFAPPLTADAAVRWLTRTASIADGNVIGLVQSA